MLNLEIKYTKEPKGYITTKDEIRDKLSKEFPAIKSFEGHEKIFCFGKKPLYPFQSLLKVNGISVLAMVTPIYV